MNNPNLDNHLLSESNLDLKKLTSILIKYRLLFVVVTSLFTFSVIIYSFAIPNTYISKAILSPTEEQSIMDQFAGSYGGIATLAGINLRSQSDMNNSQKALEKINTLSFFEESILPNIFLPDLMAVKSWNESNNTISYKEDLYDVASEKWVREYSFPKTQVPSSQESFDVFHDNLDVSEKGNGFITISVKHQSPFIAKKWTELVVHELNHFFRSKDKDEAQAALDYLNKQIAKTKFVEVKQAIAQILQQKTQQLTLIEVTDFYVFEYIDYPVVMEKRASPNRLLISFIGVILGSIIGLISVLIRYFFFNKHNLVSSFLEEE